MPRMRSLIPARKVNVAALGAALSTIGLWMLSEVTGEPLPEPVSAAIVAVVTFALGYFVPPARRDGIDIDQTEGSQTVAAPSSSSVGS